MHSLNITAIPNQAIEGVYMEIIDKERISAMLCLLEEDKSEHYKQFSEYAKEYNNELGGISVKYAKAGAWGLAYPKNGLVNLPLNIRNALIKDKYLDCDISNAGISILYTVAKCNDLPCMAIEDYYINREKHISETMDKYKVNRLAAKKLFIRLVFNGSFNGWGEEHKATNIGQYNPFLTSYITEVKYIIDRTKKANSSLWQSVSRAAGTDKSNKDGAFISKYVSEYQGRIISSCIDMLRTKTPFMQWNNNFNVLINEFDGLKILMALDTDTDSISNNAAAAEPETMTPEIFKTAVINILNEHTAEIGWPNIKFAAKEIDSSIDLTEYIERVKNNPNAVPQVLTPYETIKQEMEKSICKILSTGDFIHVIDGEMFQKSEKNLITSLRHIRVTEDEKDKKGRITTKDKCFINMWLDDGKQRRYNKITCAPPGHLNAKNDTLYNTWVPFAIEEIAKNYTPDPTAVETFKKHISILCNHQSEITDFFTKWLAHIFQHPAEKPGKMPVFLSGEGAGKSSIIRILSKMIGNRRVTSAPNPDDFLGNYNGLLLNTFIVCFEEIEGIAEKKLLPKLKTLITDETEIIHFKGNNKFTIESFHRCIGCTNAPEMMHTHDEDRRCVIISCSDELIHGENSKAYHTNFTENIINNDNALANIYKYLMSVPMYETSMKLVKIVTKFQKEMQIDNRHPVKVFIWDLITDINKYVPDYNGEETIELYPVQLVKIFNEWAIIHNCEYTVDARKISTDIRNQRIFGVEQSDRKTMKGYAKVFNISKVKSYFKNYT